MSGFPIDVVDQKEAYIDHLSQTSHKIALECSTISATNNHYGQRLCLKYLVFQRQFFLWQISLMKMQLKDAASESVVVSY